MYWSSAKRNCVCVCVVADFFRNLDNRFGPLSLHSSMPHLVLYVYSALKELGSTLS